jgi:hypothetical protein
MYSKKYNRSDDGDEQPFRREHVPEPQVDMMCNTCDEKFRGTWQSICPHCTSGDVRVLNEEVEQKKEDESNG